MPEIKWATSCAFLVLCLLLSPQPSSAQGSAPSSAHAGPAAAPQPMTIASLDDAVKIGMQHSLVLQESAKRLAASQSAVDRAAALYLPKAIVGVAVNRREATFDLPFSLASAQAKDPGLFFGYPTDYGTHIEIDQPIFTGLRNMNSLRIAKLQTAIERESQTMRRLDLEVDISRAYYSVLLAQQVLQIKQDLVAQNKRHQEDVGRRFDAGEVARFDKLRADVQLANVMPELIRARNDVEVANAELKNVLGLTRDQAIAVSGSIEYVPDDTTQQAAQIDQAIQRRPEAQMSHLSRLVSERAVSLSHAGWFPAVGAFFAQDYRSDTTGTLFGARHGNWAYGISATFSLDIGETVFRARQEQRRTEELTFTDEQVRRNIEVEITEASLELKRAAEVIESQKQNVRQAEEAMQIADKSYASGTITNLELMDTQLALDQARINYIKAVYDYLVGRARYRRAIAMPSKNS